MDISSMNGKAVKDLGLREEDSNDDGDLLTVSNEEAECSDTSAAQHDSRPAGSTGLHQLNFNPNNPLKYCPSNEPVITSVFRQFRDHYTRLREGIKKSSTAEADDVADTGLYGTTFFNSKTYDGVFYIYKDVTYIWHLHV